MQVTEVSFTQQPTVFMLRSEFHELKSFHWLVMFVIACKYRNRKHMGSRPYECIRYLDGMTQKVLLNVEHGFD